MKRKQIFFLIGTLIINHSALSQNLIKFHTKELVEISGKFGFDSVFSIIGNWSIYELDPLSASEIAQNTQNKASKHIDNYLINYALRNNQDSLINPIIQNVFEKKLKEIKEYMPNYNWELPMININLIHVLLNFPTDKSEELLIRYYNEWDKKSQEYKPDYLKGKMTNNIIHEYKHKLIKPYESCNYNCYLILLGLQKLNSSFSDNNKLDFHRSYLCEGRQSIVSLGSPLNLKNFKPTEKDKIIILSRKYKTIGDIDFNAEPELKNEFQKFSKSYLGTGDAKVIDKCCLKKLIYCENSGYLQFSCSFGPMSGKGILYRIELIDNTLVFYHINSFIS